MSKYQPNFNDPRVRSRCLKALGFVQLQVSSHKPQRLSQKHINEYFGHHGRPLGQYLRNLLLVCVDHSYSIEQHKPKQYQVKQSGIDYLIQALGDEPNSSSKITSSQDSLVIFGLDSLSSKKTTTTTLCNSAEVLATPLDGTTQLVSDLVKTHQNELKTGIFKYKSKSDRLWHPIQNIKSSVRTQLLTDQGYPNHYDIQSCAPTLLYQMSGRLGNDEWPPVIRSYIKDPKPIRQHIADQIGCDYDTAKEIISALFAGAYLAANSRLAIYQLVNNSTQAIKILKDDPVIQQLRAELKVMWQYLSTRATRKQITDKRGRERLLPLSARDKWGIYFRLENMVMYQVRRFIELTNQKDYGTNNKLFQIHDGFATSQPIDVDLLQDFIYNTTRFNLRITHAG